MTGLGLARACMVALLALSAAAQFKDRAGIQPLAGLVLQPGLGLNYQGPLLDPSRLQISHVVEMGFAGGERGSLGGGLYLNQLDYRLSPSLDMRLQLGVSSVFHNSAVPGGTGQKLVGGAELSWRPSDSFALRLAASRGPAPGRRWPGAWDSPVDGWGFTR